MAWDYPVVMQIIESVQKEQCFIWGGDVYKMTNDKVESTYDSWYARSEMTVEESLGMAKKFIGNYYQKRGKRYLYTLVIE